MPRVIILAWMIVGCFAGAMLSLFVRLPAIVAWEALSSAPAPIAELVTVTLRGVYARTGDGNVIGCEADVCWKTYPSDAELPGINTTVLRNVKPCDRFNEAFVLSPNTPKPLVDCIQTMVTYTEASSEGFYVLDADRRVWRWAYMHTPGEGILVYGIGGGLLLAVIGIVDQKRQMKKPRRAMHGLGMRRLRRR